MYISFLVTSLYKAILFIFTHIPTYQQQYMLEVVDQLL